MRSSGNGNAAVCVHNLVRISRGEIPFDRIRGVRLTEHVGKVLTEKDDLADDIKWMIKTYEPRISLDSVEIRVEDAANGHAQVKVSVSGGNQ